MLYITHMNLDKRDICIGHKATGFPVNKRNFRNLSIPFTNRWISPFFLNVQNKLFKAAKSTNTEFATFYNGKKMGIVLS